MLTESGVSCKPYPMRQTLAQVRPSEGRRWWNPSRTRTGELRAADAKELWILSGAYLQCSLFFFSFLLGDSS